jgi:hypothetical protein
MSFRYRVIRGGKLIGSIPYADGYYGQSGMAVSDDGVILDLRRQRWVDPPYLFAMICYWIDQNGRPVGRQDAAECTGRFSADIARFEVFVDVLSDETEAVLRRVDGWESVKPERIIDLGEQAF